jgi:hypothetical protein
MYDADEPSTGDVDVLADTGVTPDKPAVKVVARENATIRRTDFITG